jgi:hypothetical protein
MVFLNKRTTSESTKYNLRFEGSSWRVTNTYCKRILSICMFLYKYKIHSDRSAHIHPIVILLSSDWSCQPTKGSITSYSIKYIEMYSTIILYSFYVHIYIQRYVCTYDRYILTVCKAHAFSLSYDISLVLSFAPIVVSHSIPFQSGLSSPSLSCSPCQPAFHSQHFHLHCNLPGLFVLVQNS